jgi:hypothetical protein
MNVRADILLNLLNKRGHLVEQELSSNGKIYIYFLLHSKGLIHYEKVKKP